MARQSKAGKLQAVHQQALGEFDNIASACGSEREQSLEDRRFYSIAGAMWEGAIGDQFANRPMLEVNKVHLSVIRIINDYRNNRIDAEFVSRTGDEGDDLADVCAGLYRADQEDSVAEEAYDNAFEEAVGGGFGAWRICAEYEDEYDEDDDRQRIKFEPIYDADTTVYFDASAKRQDKSDAKHCFVLNGMTHEAYKDEYEDDPKTWPKDVGSTEFDWSTPELVYVAEYYRVEETTRTVVKYKTVGGRIEAHNQDDLDDQDIADLNAVGTIPISSKKVKARKIRKYILSGGGVLEDCGYIAGTEIPIVPVYGKRWYVDGQERFMGHVRLAKDPARLKNMQISVLAEKAARGDDETPIFAPEQMAVWELLWANRAVEKPGFLLVNPIQGPDGQQVYQGPLGYTQTAQVPAAMAALLQISEDDINDILGNQQGGEEIRSNISGDAVELIQGRLDMQTFIYMSNFAKAVRRSAQIWLGMARDLYDEDDRKMKTIDESGEVEFVDIGKSVMGNAGKPERLMDLTRAKFDVTTKIGPTSSTKRASVTKSLIGMMGAVTDPTDQKIISSMILRNMEGEGLSSLRDYFRKQLVQMGVEEPTDEEAEEMAAAMQGQQPDPQTIYLQSEAQKNEAQAEKAKADTVGAIADAEYAKARTAKTLAEIEIDQRDSVVNAVEKLTKESGTTTPQVVRQQGPRPV